MNFYKIIKISKYIKSTPLKLIGIYILYVLGRRFLSVRIDPSLSCNLRCKMCFFSSKEERLKLHGNIPIDDFDHIARVLFPRAIQVYVGCGAEPTTNKNFIHLLHLAKRYNVPNTALVTNFQILSQEQIQELVDLEIDEITISCHGVRKETYEFFMENASFDRFHENLKCLQEYKMTKKSAYPEIRINYTVNAENLEELRQFFTVFSKIDTLQIRPMDDIGGVYNKTIDDTQLQQYNAIIEFFEKECNEKKVRLIANKKNPNSRIRPYDNRLESAVYCYIGPHTSDQLDMEWSLTDFSAFIKKSKWSRKMKALLLNKKSSTLHSSAGNYKIS